MHVATVSLPRLDLDQNRGHFRLVDFWIFKLLAADRCRTFHHSLSVPLWIQRFC